MNTIDWSPQLENNIVFLRILNRDDYYNLERYAVEEPETWQFSLYSAAGKHGMESYITRAIEEQTDQKCIPFIVFDKRTQQYAGSTRFYNIDEVQRNISIGYTWYGKEFRGTGLNKHCKFLLLEYAFETMGMLRVEFRADDDNTISKAAINNIGATHEGVLRSDSNKANGERRNSAVFSILLEEWQENLKEQLAQSINPS